MKTYIIKYWYENKKEDCADWAEKKISATEFEEALEFFKRKVRVYKRIESIIETK